MASTVEEFTPTDISLYENISAHADNGPPPDIDFSSLEGKTIIVEDNISPIYVVKYRVSTGDKQREGFVLFDGEKIVENIPHIEGKVYVKEEDKHIAGETLLQSLIMNRYQSFKDSFESHITSILTESARNIPELAPDILNITEEHVSGDIDITITLLTTIIPLKKKS